MTSARRRTLNKLKGHRVVVQTRDDRSLRGILTEVGVDCLVVSQLEYLEEGKATELPGRAWVLDANVSWVHDLAGGA